MVAEAIADLHQLALSPGSCVAGKIGQRTVDEIARATSPGTTAPCPADAHRLKRVEHVGRAVDQLRPAAGERRRLKSAAQLFGFLVERADADCRDVSASKRAISSCRNSRSAGRDWCQIVITRRDRCRRIRSAAKSVNAATTRQGSRAADRNA